MRWCANKDVGPRKGVDLVGPDWRKERLSTRTFGPEWGWIVRSHNPTLVGEENETPFIRM